MADELIAPAVDHQSDSHRPISGGAASRSRLRCRNQRRYEWQRGFRPGLRFKCQVAVS